MRRLVLKPDGPAPWMSVTCGARCERKNRPNGVHVAASTPRLASFQKSRTRVSWCLSAPLAAFSLPASGSFPSFVAITC